jgi:MFS family permease
MKKHGIFYGWRIVAAAALGLFWGAPVTVFSFSVFLRPLMHDFHTGRTAVSLGFTVGGIAAAMSAPFVGRLTDRLGARTVILPSTLIFGSILICARWLTSSIWQFYLFHLALGLILNGVGPVPYGYMISCWFDKRRGLALGLMMIGIGSGAMIMPILAQQLIGKFGWRNSYAILGAAVLLISAPAIALFLKEKPEDMGLLPDGATSVNSGARKIATPGMSGRDVWGNRTFWLMVCAFFLVGASVHGCAVHIVAMLIDRGVAVQTAALVSSIVGAAVFTGRVGTGYLLDRFFAPHVAAIFFGGVAAGIGLLWIGNVTAMTVAGVFLVGMGLGAEVDIIAYLMSRYFGLRYFGEIYGFSFAAFLLAGALGSLMMGAGFDLTGSYHAPLAALFVSSLLATWLMTRLGPYRYPTRQAAESVPFLAIQEMVGN